MPEQGRKYDGGKLRYDLIPVLALEEMVKGLTFGTIKYDDNNWIKVPNGRKRYMAAALRHIQEYRKGNLWDEEQDIHHLSAAMNNLSFIVEKDLQGWEDTVETVFETEEDFFEHGKEIAKELDAKDISQEELKAYVKTIMPVYTIQLQNSAEELWYPPVEDGGNPWIEYNGSGQPVKNGTMILAMERQERERCELNHSISFRAETNEWEWSKAPSEYNIVAYRVVD